MPRRFSVAISILLLVFISRWCVAERAAAKAGSEDREAVHVRLGASVVALYGPWKFQVGDSPIDSATGRPLWSEASFDDSQWETVELTPKDGAIDPISGLSTYVPGWTARGHRGYWGYAWYRIRAPYPFPTKWEASTRRHCWERWKQFPLSIACVGMN
jgi:hypothetical protein